MRLVRERKPLVHQITNYVVMNETANATLALGALPVMAHARCKIVSPYFCTAGGLKLFLFISVFLYFKRLSPILQHGKLLAIYAKA